MKKAIIFVGIMLLAVGLAACSSKGTSKETSSEEQVMSKDTESEGEEMTGNVKKLSAEEAHARMTSGDPVVVVDVRTAEEYAEKHIEGAILIPNEEIGAERPELLPLRDAEILIYCRSGNRSAQAAEKLVKLGYSNISDFGGINDWSYDTVSGEWENKEGKLSSFRTTDINGRTVDESIFSDSKVTMINVWATYCGPCLREMPDLGELSAEYKDKGVQVVGIVLDTQRQAGEIDADQVVKARELVEQTGADYAHLLPSKELIEAGLNSIYSVPTTLFVDSNGDAIGSGYMGAQDKEGWATIIEEKLAEVEK